MNEKHDFNNLINLVAGEGNVHFNLTERLDFTLSRGCIALACHFKKRKKCMLNMSL